jgi:hypothetical protein
MKRAIITIASVFGGLFVLLVIGSALFPSQPGSEPSESRTKAQVQAFSPDDFNHQLDALGTLVSQGNWDEPRIQSAKLYVEAAPVRISHRSHEANVARALDRYDSLARSIAQNGWKYSKSRS